jgi:capsular exopolysaccharide synthesis family protein
MLSQPAAAIRPAVEPLTPQPSLPQPIEEVHILDRLAAVFRHIRLVASVFAVVLAIGLVHSYSTVPRYLAKATILIQDERSTSVTNLSANDRTYWEDPEPYFNTQYQILRGRGLGRRVVGKLDLVHHPVPSGPESGLFATFGAARSKLSAWIRAKTSSSPATAAPQEPPSRDETSEESAAVGAFVGGIQVIPVKGTRLVDVTYDSTDPQFAAVAVNTLVQEYVEQNLDLRLRNIDTTLDWLGQQLSKQALKVEEAERAMADYRTEQNALSLDNRQNIVGARLNQLNDAVTKAKTARLEKQALHDQVRNLDPNSPNLDTFPVVAQSPVIQTLKGQLSSLESERAKNAERWGPNHPEMQKLNGSIENVRRQLQLETAKVVESIRNEYRAALANEQSLAASLEDQKRQAMDLDRKSASYTVLEREAASEREVYNSLLQQEKELRVIRNSRANNIQIMDTAETPKGPYVPNRRKDILMSIVLGLALAVGLAFGIEYLDDTIKTPDDVTRRLRLPLLGLVPAVRGERAPILARQVPHDFGEAFRSLRTSLVFTSRGDGPRLIGVTSTQPLEGKTTTACNLAMVLAYGGARVLLIDADMRRPGLHRTMGIENQAGLSHVLTGQARVRDVVRRTHDPNLLVMTAGRTPPNPSELLASTRMRQLLQNLASGPFDWVIVDTPPVLAVTDAVILSAHLSGLAFVVGAEMTRRAHVDRAIETLQTGQPRIIGVVLNRVDFDRNKYYYSRYYGYQYKSYYGTAATPA